MVKRLVPAFPGFGGFGPIAGALMGELQAFWVTFTAKGRDAYAACLGHHDDLVIAVDGGITVQIVRFSDLPAD